MKFSIKDFFSKCDQIAGNRRFGYIYWRTPQRKISFFVQWHYLIASKINNVILHLNLPSQHFNVGSTLWINVEITLIRRWKWNKIRRRIFNVAQRWYNFGVWRWNNVETMLIQLYLDVVSTWSQLWVKAIAKPVGIVISTDL